MQKNEVITVSSSNSVEINLTGEFIISGFNVGFRIFWIEIIIYSCFKNRISLKLTLKCFNKSSGLLILNGTLRFEAGMYFKKL